MINFINQFQANFPINQQPFLTVAKTLGVSEHLLIESIQSLLKDGILSRFGALYDSQQMGGDVCLVAMNIAPVDFDRVAAEVNDFEAVAHNYQREHEFNLWFVLSTEKKSAQTTILKQIEAKTGYAVYPFPKLQEYYVGLKFFIEADGKAKTLDFDLKKMPPHQQALTDFQRQIIKATQAGLPICSEPYQQIAQLINCSEKALLEAMTKMLKTGIIRRIGAIPNHYKLGIKANGMSVWDVPEAEIDKIGQKIGKLDFVSHCYHRPRHLPEWRYNLFAMVHAQERDQVIAQVEKIKTLLSPHYRQHDILFSKRILKKVGLRLS